MQCDRHPTHFKLLVPLSAALAGIMTGTPGLAAELIAQVNNCPGVFTKTVQQCSCSPSRLPSKRCQQSGA
ncbi:MAG: hypothetical protein HC899_31790, partial [Leptolyngbyaceae cyanobacterium SM1_4_3]|nr:hypothetical protein [Leptolyngbyaceae cyanobacterium SM1_4_3]